jgi:hypothetical protein
MKTWKEMNDDERFYTLKTMQNCGGGFASKLADAWMNADSGNATQLGYTFGYLAAKFGPQSDMYLGPKPVVNKFNHMYSVAFSVETPNDWEEVTKDELISGLRARLKCLETEGSEEIYEACNPPLDTFGLEPA